MKINNEKSTYLFVLILNLISISFSKKLTYNESKKYIINDDPNNLNLSNEFQFNDSINSSNNKKYLHSNTSVSKVFLNYLDFKTRYISDVSKC